jgi:hypothetical protein
MELVPQWAVVEREIERNRHLEDVVYGCPEQMPVRYLVKVRAD